MTDNGQQQQQQPHPAYCEEFSEEAQATVPETRQSANIAAKRSKASEHPKARKTLRDEFSDSGYSSHTHGTLNSSLDSKLDHAQSGATVHHALVPFVAEPDVIKSRAQSPDKDLTATAPKRTRSKNRRDGGGASARRRECGCDNCIAAARPSHLLLDPYQTSVRPSAHPPSRHRTPAPPSPQSRRTPQVAMPLREHTRTRPPTSARPRPMSYHGGATPDPNYVPAQPTYLLDHPPPATQTAYPFLQPSYPPQPSFYQAAPPPPPPPAPQDYFQPMQPQMYEIQPQMQPPPRPPTRQWTSERPPERPQSMFYAAPPPQPIYDYEYGDDPIYTVMMDPQPQQQRRDHSLSRRDPHSSLRETYAGRPSVPSSEDSRRMPPPPHPPKPRPEYRPQIRHAATAAGTVHTDPRRSSHDEPRQSTASTSRKPSFDTSQPSRSRRPSLARPSLRTSEDKNVSFDGLQRGIQGMTLEPISTNTTSNSSSKSRRRSSVYGGHGESALRDLEGDVEAYQATQRLRSNTSASNSTTPISPLATNEDLLSRLPLGTRKKTDSSETGSRTSQRSGGSGSGLRARRPSNNDVGSTSSRENKEGRDSNAGNLALRFNPEGVNIKMQGGIDGRAINLRKSKDGEKGDLELSIGSKDESKTDRRKQIMAAHHHTERTVPALSGAPTVRQIEHSAHHHHHHQQDRRGRETPVSLGSRPSLAGRERSRRRYSYVEGGGGGVREVPHEEGGYSLTKIGSRDPYEAVAGGSGARIGSRDEGGGGLRPSGSALARTGSSESREEEYGGAGGARIIGERIVTTMRSRRSSRYKYD